MVNEIGNGGRIAIDTTPGAARWTLPRNPDRYDPSAGPEQAREPRT